MTENEAPKSLGRYQIVRELGHGAMGIVYEGLDPNIGRRVAIKTARRDVMESSGRGDEMMERFLREARAAGALNHPNIITIYDADEEQDGLAYIAMELLDGQDLFKISHEKRRFDVKDAVEICATVCAALAHAHEHGVVHRDVKPSNIIVLNNGQIKVADFGIARVSDSNLTQEGAMIGTPHYMSPEQFMGHKVDARSDLFSVGIILYELITGEKPFGGDALSTVMHNVIKTAPVAPHDLNFAVNECLSKVVMKALSKDPNQRYQNGNAMAAALRESIKESPDPAVTQVGAVAPRPLVAETIVAQPPAGETVLGPGGPGDTLAVDTRRAPPEALVSVSVAPRTEQTSVPTGQAATSLSRRKLARIVIPALVIFTVLGGAALVFNGSGGRDVDVRLYMAPDKKTMLEKDMRTVQECDDLVAQNLLYKGTGKVSLTNADNPKEEVLIEAAEGVGKGRIGKNWKGFVASVAQPGFSGDNKTVTLSDSDRDSNAPVQVFLTMLRQ